MERFSGAIQSAYEEHECPPRIHEALGRLIERKVPEIDGYLLSPVSSLPSKVADVLQLGTRRTIDLTESSIREINREQVISSCLLVRGVLETACLMWDLTRRVSKDVRAGTDLTDLITTATGDFKLPYGNLPRLILAWLCTEAVQTQSRELALGRSLSDCIRNAVPSNDRLSEVVFQAQAETEQLHVVCHDGARYRFAPVPAQIRHVAAQRNPFETLAMEG